jgi:Zn-dependent protease
LLASVFRTLVIVPSALEAHKIVDFAIQLAVILFAISFHESAHAWTALKFGDTTARDLGRISLNPLRHIDPVGSILVPILLYIFSGLIFGAAKPTPVDLRRTRNPRMANLAVSAAGPVSNILLATIGILLLKIIGATDKPAIVNLYYALSENRFAGGTLAPLAYILFIFVMVNVSLAIFNMLPIPPLDGSGVAVSLFGPPAARLYALIAPFGFFILILLIGTPILRTIFRPFQLAVYRLVFGGL